VDAVLHFHLDRQHGIFLGPQATYPIGVAFNYDTRQSQLGLDMTVLDGEHFWDSGEQSCLSVDFRVFYSLRPTGTSVFSGTFENKNLVLTYQMDVRGSLGGERLGSMVLGPTLGRLAVETPYNPGTVPGAAERFRDLIARPLQLAVRCWN
jgi:hypothetical protein